MFGLKIFKETKTKKFKNDKERKQYYAIQSYYKNKNATLTPNKNKDKK